MTVKELIGLLRMMNPDYEVTISPLSPTAEIKDFAHVIPIVSEIEGATGKCPQRA